MVDFDRLAAAAKVLKVVEDVASSGGSEVLSIGDGCDVRVEAIGDEK